MKKRTMRKAIKMAAAALCLLGVTIYALSGGFSTASESKENSIFSAFGDGDSDLQLPDSLKIQEDVDFEGKAPFQITFNSNQFVEPMESYSWNFGDGEMATGAVASHTFVSAGRYYVTLIAKQKSGQVHQKRISVFVEPKQ
jgi:hypothetical protein